MLHQLPSHPNISSIIAQNVAGSKRNPFFIRSLFFLQLAKKDPDEAFEATRNAAGFPLRRNEDGLA